MKTFPCICSVCGNRNVTVNGACSRCGAEPRGRAQGHSIDMVDHLARVRGRLTKSTLDFCNPGSRMFDRA